MAVYWLSACVVFSLAAGVGAQTSSGNNDSLVTHERKLFHYLLDNYEPSVRPVRNTSEKITVSVSATLISINELNVKASTLSTTVWTYKMWTDIMLRWNPDDFGGVNSIRLPANRVWLPDIVVYNSRAANDVAVLDHLVIVDNQGSVLWVPPENLRTHCSLDMRSFPFDTQTCAIKFGSWTYDGDKVDVKLYDGMKTFDMNDYIMNPEWEILATSVRKNVLYYPCCTEPFPDITYNLTIQRRSTYYSYVFIAPAVAVSLLIPFMFLLPAASRQKIQLGGSLAILILILLFMLENMLPNGGQQQPSIVVMYYVSNLFLVSASLALNIFLENLFYHSQNKHPPGIIKKIFLTVLGKLVFVSEDPYQRMEPGSISLANVQLSRGESSHNETQGSSVDQSNDKARLCYDQSQATNEWSLICIVLDRLFFLTFLVVVVVFCCVFFT